MAEKRETMQKRIIQNLIDNTKSFFTAEDIYKKLKKENPKVGIATVYRFLKELQKERIIHSFTCSRKNLYSRNGMSHCHFVCEICEVRKHINLSKIDFLDKFIEDELCHFQIEISGICKNCKSKMR
jgi:Fe2+ or Zn2+ uptake regulation protein